MRNKVDGGVQICVGRVSSLSSYIPNAKTKETRPKVMLKTGSHYPEYWFVHGTHQQDDSHWENHKFIHTYTCEINNFPSRTIIYINKKE